MMRGMRLLQWLLALVPFPSLSLSLLLCATPAGALEFVRIDDPGNPPDTTPPNHVGTSGVCADGTTLCTSDAHCSFQGAPPPCTKFEWPDEYQERGDVDYVYLMSRTAVSVAEYAAYLNTVGRQAPDRALDGRPHPTRPIPPLLSGSPGDYTALLPDFPWPYADRDDAMRYVNWLGDGDETGGSYDCSGEHCDPTRLAGARFFLPNLDEWRKAATWDEESQSWWRQPGGGGAEPEPGVDANVAASVGWGSYGNCDAGTQYPLAECQFVPNGSYPHYRSPWGVEDMCGNGIEIGESCGELFGEIDCSRMLIHGIHPWYGSKDCHTEDIQQAEAYGVNFSGTKIRIARKPLPFRPRRCCPRCCSRAAAGPDGRVAWSAELHRGAAGSMLRQAIPASTRSYSPRSSAIRSRELNIITSTIESAGTNSGVRWSYSTGLERRNRSATPRSAKTPPS
jgi:hypothetical protein